MGQHLQVIRSSQLKVNLEPSILELFAHMAAEHDRSMSDYARVMIIQELRANNYLSDTTIANLVTGRAKVERDGVVVNYEPVDSEQVG